MPFVLFRLWRITLGYVFCIAEVINPADTSTDLTAYQAVAHAQTMRQKGFLKNNMESHLHVSLLFYGENKHQSERITTWNNVSHPAKHPIWAGSKPSSTVGLGWGGGG